MTLPLLTLTARGLAIVIATVLGMGFGVTCDALARDPADNAEAGDLRGTLSRIISIDLREVTLDSALQVVSQLSGVPLNYSHSRITASQIVSVKKDSLSAYQVLTFLLSYTDAALASAGNGQVAVVERAHASVNSGVIRGIVLDSATQRPIHGATALLVDRYSLTSTDSSGAFAFTGMSAGPYTVSISHIGYNNATVTGIEPVAGSSPVLRMLLTTKTLQLPSIIVSPGTFVIMETGAMARQALTREDIQTVAQFGEDVYRTVTRIPGVTADDYSARFSVRGGRYENVLVLLDGQEIQEPFHVKDVNGGVVSIIDADAVEGITLRTGGFPAEYGNRTSGVFDIATKHPVMEKSSLSVGWSLTNFRVMTEGVFGDGRGSWLFVARRGYLDLVLDLMKEIESPRPAYYDLLSRVSYRLSPRHDLSLHFLHARDKMTFYSTDPDGDIDRSDSRFGNTYGWVSLASTLGARIAVRTNLSVARITRDRWGETINVPLDRLFFRVIDINAYDEYGIKQDWTLSVTDKTQLRWGIDYKPAATEFTTRSDIVDSTVDEFGVPDLDTVTHETYIDNNGQTLGAYISSRLPVTRRLTLELGGRFDYATHTGDEDWSPRIGAAFQLGPQTYVRAGWGQYRQIQAMNHLDVLDGVTSYYPSELATHWTAGIEHKLPSGIDLRLEAYDIRSSNPNPSFRNWKNDLYQFHNAVEDDRIAVYPAEYTRRGLEVFARKSNGGRFQWIGSYAFAVNEEQLDSVSSYFYEVFYFKNSDVPFDQRHSLMFGGTYRFSDSWTLNVSWSFHTGWPYTRARIDTVHAESGNVYYLRPGPINGDRLPSYSSLNTRVTRHVDFQGGHLRMYLDVLNLFGHSNVYAVDGEILDSPAAPRLEFEDQTWLSWLPSIGITWTKDF